jgi:hypothetical protein
LDTEFGESLIRFFAESELEKTEWVNELTTIKKKMDGDRAAREGHFPSFSLATSLAVKEL